MSELYLPEVTGNTANPSVAEQVFTAVNCSGLTKANGYLKIDLRCDVPANLGASRQIEITSSGGSDVNEWNIPAPIGEITVAYKTFELPLVDAVTNGGELDVTAINYLRWYNFSTDGNITVYWRNAYAIVRVDKSLSGVFSSTGGLGRKILISLLGVFGFSGVLSPSKIYHKALSGVLTFTKASLTVIIYYTWGKVTKALGDWGKVSKSGGDFTKVNKEKGEWNKVEKE